MALLELNKTHQAGSFAPLSIFLISLPCLGRVFKPGKIRFCLPWPMYWPRFKSLMFLPNLPRPRLLPALLTEVQAFHKSEPVTEIQNTSILYKIHTHTKQGYVPFKYTFVQEAH